MNSDKKIFILNGSNLNMLGLREPDVYGMLSLEYIDNLLLQKQSELKQLNIDVIDFESRQTNSEVEAIELIQQLFTKKDNVAGLIINPGAWTHYSYALRDALALLKQTNIPVVEVHLSQTASREKFRHNSVISEVVSGTISGLGEKVYILAYEFLNSKKQVINVKSKA